MSNLCAPPSCAVCYLVQGQQAGIAGSLFASVLIDWHRMTSACANSVDNCGVYAFSTSASRGQRRLPLLSKHVSNRASSSGAGSADGQQPAAQSEAEITCGHVCASRECPHARKQVMHSQLDDSRCLALCDSPSTHHEQDLVAFTAPDAVIDGIMRNHLKQETEATLGHHSLHWCLLEEMAGSTIR